MKLPKCLLLFVFFSVSALALDDSKENRIQQAERYMATMPPEELMQDMAKNVAMNFPPDQREEFRELLLKHVNINTLSDAMKVAMVNAFTADELAALADFYAKPIAKSAMQKFGVYMAEVMPVVQAEVLRAVGEMEKEKAEKNRKIPDIE
ncbi:DUF2059 domain-containing protein [Porticoccaceae bacterium LTM1]|nr:DUF2059 domain-containing protein [Porticoccaceae bacterium LTM1]